MLKEADANRKSLSCKRLQVKSSRIDHRTSNEPPCMQFRASVALCRSEVAKESTFSPIFLPEVLQVKTCSSSRNPGFASCLQMLPQIKQM